MSVGRRLIDKKESADIYVEVYHTIKGKETKLLGTDIVVDSHPSEGAKLVTIGRFIVGRGVFTKQTAAWDRMEVAILRGLLVLFPRSDIVFDTVLKYRNPKGNTDSRRIHSNLSKGFPVQMLRNDVYEGLFKAHTGSVYIRMGQLA